MRTARISPSRRPSSSTWTSPPKAGRSTPYEVLRRDDRQQHTVRPQDGIEETWRVMQPLLDSPPPVHTYQPGSWGPSAADNLPAGFAPGGPSTHR